MDVRIVGKCSVSLSHIAGILREICDNAKLRKQNFPSFFIREHFHVTLHETCKEWLHKSMSEFYSLIAGFALTKIDLLFVIL